MEEDLQVDPSVLNSEVINEEDALQEYIRDALGPRGPLGVGNRGQRRAFQRVR